MKRHFVIPVQLLSGIFSCSSNFSAHMVQGTDCPDIPPLDCCWGATASMGAIESPISDALRRQRGRCQEFWSAPGAWGWYRPCSWTRKLLTFVIRRTALPDVYFICRAPGARRPGAGAHCSSGCAVRRHGRCAAPGATRRAGRRCPPGRFNSSRRRGYES